MTVDRSVGTRQSQVPASGSPSQPQGQGSGSGLPTRNTFEKKDPWDKRRRVDITLGRSKSNRTTSIRLSGSTIRPPQRASQSHACACKNRMAVLQIFETELSECTSLRHAGTNQSSIFRKPKHAPARPQLSVSDSYYVLFFSTPPDVSKKFNTGLTFFNEKRRRFPCIATAAKCSIVDSAHTVPLSGSGAGGNRRSKEAMI